MPPKCDRALLRPNNCGKTVLTQTRLTSSDMSDYATRRTTIGKLVTQGTPQQVRSDPRVVDAYLGDLL